MSNVITKASIIANAPKRWYRQYWRGTSWYNEKAVVEIVTATRRNGIPQDAIDWFAKTMVRLAEESPT